MTRILMIFRNEDDRDFDKFILAPKGMAMVIADGVVKTLVKALRDADAEADWDVIEAALVTQGFKMVDSWFQSEVRL